MTLTHLAPWSDGLIHLLADAALRSLLLAAAAGIGLALLRVKSTTLRLFTWTGVLYAALALPLLSWMLPAVPIPVPSAFAPVPATSSPVKRSLTPPSKAVANVPTFAAVVKQNPNAAKISEASRKAFPFSEMSDRSRGSATLQWLSTNSSFLASVGYLTISILMVSRLALGSLLSNRLVSRAVPISHPKLVPGFASYLQARTRAPRILESDLVTVPVTLGTIRPAIVLPANWRTWNASRLDGVIAHELSHVARCDALTQFLSRIYRAVFWFHPLSWWLHRRIHLLAEQASDEAALSGGVDRTEYARTLLGFFEILRAAPGRVWWHGVAMAKVGQAEHRLERILSWRGAANMRAKKLVVVAVVVAAVPAIYVVAAAHPVSHAVVLAQSSDTAEQAPAVMGIPRVPAAPAVAPSAPIHGVEAGVVVPALPGAPVAAIPVPPAPVLWSGQSHVGTPGGFSYAYGYDDEQRFVIVSGNSDAITMSGTGEDARHVQKLKKYIPGDFIWFQRDEKSYVIRDRATVDRARKLWAPQEELGKKQEELGKQQEELGKQQEALGKQMEQVRVNVPDMTAQLDALKAKLQKLGPSATMEQIGDLQSEIGELQSKLGELQSHAGEEQGKFGSQMGELGAKQGKLGEEQGKLGEQQAELAEKAIKQMKQLLDDAIKNGTAQPEPEMGGGASL
jgi:bla regulator protein BlaR1